jgi:hypothetical protein
MIILLLAILYLSVFAAARKSGKDFNTYAAKNFSYLKNMSFVSDLLVKYVVITLLILAGQPEWVSPICTLFVGDYLVQGRFFTLPLRLSLTSGILCILGAGFQAYIGSPLLTWPALAALIASSASLWHLQKLQAIAATQSAQELEAE